DDGLARGPDGVALLELLAATLGDPGALGREAFDVVGLELEQGLGDQQREVGVLVPGGLDAAVEQPLDVLPEAVAVGPDDHGAAHGRVVGELGLAHDLEVPAREIIRLVGQVLYELLLLLGVAQGVALLFPASAEATSGRAVYPCGARPSTAPRQEGQRMTTKRSVAEWSDDVVARRK